MQRLIIHLVLLVSMPLVAMNMHEGMWDEHGNYLAPANAPAQPYSLNSAQQSMMLVPHMVYVPMNAYGQMMGQPLPFVPPMSHYPSYNLQNGMPSFVPPYNGNQMVYQQQPFFPAMVDLHQWSEQEQPVAQDREIDVVTQEIEQIAIDDQSNQTASTSTVLDVDAFLSSLRAIHADAQSNDLKIPSEDQDPSPAQPVSLSCAKVAHAAPADAVSIDTQKKPQNDGQSVSNTKKYDQVSSAVSSSSTKAKEISNGRLIDALAMMRKRANPTTQLQQLAQNKFKWIDTLPKESDRIHEWENIVQLFEQSKDFAAEVTVPGQATVLMHLAGTLVENAEKIDKRVVARRQFARLALECLERVAPALPVTCVEHASNISDRASALVGNRQGVEDQSDIKGTDFYEGHEVRVAEVAIRSDGKVLPAVVGRMEPEGDVHVKKAKKVPNTKQKQHKPVQKKPTTQQPKPTPNNNQHEQMMVPKVVVPKKKPEVPLRERIEKLFEGNVKQTREGIALLVQMADEEIPGVGHVDRVWAMRTAGLVYLYGNAKYENNGQSEILVQAKDYGRAKYFLEKAYAAGDVFVLTDLLVHAFYSDRSKIGTYVAQIQAHEEVTDILKESCRFFQTAVQFIDDEQAGLSRETLAQLQQLHDCYSIGKSMRTIADLLPVEFYHCADRRLSEWNKKLIEQGADAKEEEVAECCKWLYLIHRLHRDGDPFKFRVTRYKAMTWSRRIASLGNRQAQLYLATPEANSEDMLDIHDRVEYLVSAMNNREQQIPADQEHMEQLCEDYAVQGFLGPIMHYLCKWHASQGLDGALRNLGASKIHITTNLYKKKPCILDDLNYACARVQANGIIDELKKREANDWVARAVLSALEIYHCRAHEEVTSETIQIIDAARKRIEDDAKTHPQLESLVGACYATRAFALQQLASGISFAAMHKKQLFLEQVVKDFEEAVKRGDLFGKFSYALTLLTTKLNNLADSKGFGLISPTTHEPLFCVSLEDKGVALLKEILDDQDGEYKYDAFLTLIKYFGTIRDWDNVDVFLKKAHEWARCTYDESARASFRNLEEDAAVRSKKDRNSRSNHAGALKTKKLALAMQEKNKHAIDDTLLYMKSVEETLLNAAECARTQPFKALGILNTVNMGIASLMLPTNPRIIALLFMLLDDMSLGAFDKQMELKIRAPFFKKFDPHYKCLTIANGQYQFLAAQKDYVWRRFERLVHAYLYNWTFKTQIMEIIEKIPAEDIPRTVRAAIKKDERHFDLDVDQIPDDAIVDHVKQAIQNALDRTRNAYTTAFNAEGAALTDLLSNL